MLRGTSDKWILCNRLLQLLEGKFEGFKSPDSELLAVREVIELSCDLQAASLDSVVELGEFAVQMIQFGIVIAIKVIDALLQFLDTVAQCRAFLG